MLWQITELRLATFRRIVAVNYSIPEKVSAEAADVIWKVCPCSDVLFLSHLVQLLQYDPQERLPLSEVLNHPWVVKYRPKGVVRPSVELSATYDG